MKYKYISLILALSVSAANPAVSALAGEISPPAMEMAIDNEEMVIDDSIDEGNAVMDDSASGIPEEIFEISDEAEETVLQATAGEEAGAAAENAAAEVRAIIEALPSPEEIVVMKDESQITSMKEAVNNAGDRFEALSNIVVGNGSANAKSLISDTLQRKLMYCQDAIKNLDSYIEEARNFTTRANSLPPASDIQLSDESYLSTLEAEAQALSDNARSRVDDSVFQHLADARAKITLLKNQEKQQEGENKINDYINNVITPLINSGEYTQEQQGQIQSIIDELRRKIQELVDSGQEISQAQVDALIQDAKDKIAQVPTVHHVAAQQYESKLKAYKKPENLTLEDRAAVQSLLNEFNALSDKAKALVKQDYIQDGETYKDRLDALKNRISELEGILEKAKNDAKSYVHKNASITPDYYAASGISESYAGIDGMIQSGNYDADGVSQLDAIRDEADRKIGDNSLTSADSVNRIRDDAISKAAKVRDKERKLADDYESRIENMGPPIELARNQADTVAALRSEYNNMPPHEKKYTETDKTRSGETFKQRLEAYEARIDKMAQDDAAAVAQQISALPAINDITVASEGRIAEARKAYDSLTKEAKSKVSGDVLDRLKAAEQRLALEKEKENLKSLLNDYADKKRANTTYEPDQLAAVGSAQAQGINNIASSGTYQDAQTAYENAKKAIDSVETKAQRLKKAGARVDFGTMRFRSTKQEKTRAFLYWSGVKDITGFQLYSKKKGEGWKLIRQFDYSARSWKHTGLEEGTKYTYKLVAFTVVDGEIIPVVESMPVYVTTKGGKKQKSNVKKVNVRKIGNKAQKQKKGSVRFTLKAGKTAKISAKEVKSTGSGIKRCRRLKYESSNPAVAKVNSKGVIKAIAPGSCNICVYSQTGTYKLIKVTVKR